MEKKTEQWSDKKIQRRTFFSFAGFLLASVGGWFSWKWFSGLPPTNNRLPELTRDVLSFNERIKDKFFSHKHLAKTYPKARAARKPRLNGFIGIKDDIDTEKWRLEVVSPTGKPSIYFQLKDIQALPKEEIIFDFKCIEGWDQIVHYSGIKFSDFLNKYKLGKKEGTNEWYKYVGLETPDAKYYVGLDIESVLHPQTLLCFEVNNQPLPKLHGAPLRLIIPVKYGVKNLKRIGKMYFSDTPPRDYWHEYGYDYDVTL
ncbi:molybdopterin-dependent oxidoreductase [Emticicia agri]|uniref:Molybdopterin-binding oxidoreductase n=1 Tax=Emticicia agri TaxID=2492393 RepID=A0A4Q5M0L4_9BACT|nr:molybdopterin-dependent oxidoreductase [Emticicia agri]RYU95741.1 molybdopterin-binding oxidoreductase [Emticicia agri]